jgi:hypothetical protein
MIDTRVRLAPPAPSGAAVGCRVLVAGWWRVETTRTICWPARVMGRRAHGEPMAAGTSAPMAARRVPDRARRGGTPGTSARRTGANWCHKNGARALHAVAATAVGGPTGLQIETPCRPMGHQPVPVPGGPEGPRCHARAGVTVWRSRARWAVSGKVSGRSAPGALIIGGMKNDREHTSHTGRGGGLR